MPDRKAEIIIETPIIETPSEPAYPTGLPDIKKGNDMGDIGGGNLNDWISGVPEDEQHTGI